MLRLFMWVMGIVGMGRGARKEDDGVCGVRVGTVSTSALVEGSGGWALKQNHNGGGRVCNHECVNEAQGWVVTHAYIWEDGVACIVVMGRYVGRVMMIDTKGLGLPLSGRGWVHSLVAQLGAVPRCHAVHIAILRRSWERWGCPTALLPPRCHAVANPSRPCPALRLPKRPASWCHAVVTPRTPCRAGPGWWRCSPRRTCRSGTPHPRSKRSQSAWNGRAGGRCAARSCRGRTVGLRGGRAGLAGVGARLPWHDTHRLQPAAQPAPVHPPNRCLPSHMHGWPGNGGRRPDSGLPPLTHHPRITPRTACTTEGERLPLHAPAGQVHLWVEVEQ